MLLKEKIISASVKSFLFSTLSPFYLSLEEEHCIICLFDFVGRHIHGVYQAFFFTLCKQGRMRCQNIMSNNNSNNKWWENLVGYFPVVCSALPFSFLVGKGDWFSFGKWREPLFSSSLVCFFTFSHLCWCVSQRELAQTAIPCNFGSLYKYITRVGRI